MEFFLVFVLRIYLFQVQKRLSFDGNVVEILGFLFNSCLNGWFFYGG